MATFRVRTNVGSATGPKTVASKIFASFFFLVFTAAGVAMAGFFFVMMKSGMVSWGWQRSQCRVLTSQVEDLLYSLSSEKAAVEGSPYQLAVTYEWQRDGRTFTGSGVGGHQQFRTRGGAEAALARYPPGAVVSCYVDPANAAEATLRRARPWSLIFAALPLIFAAFGIAGLVGIWRGSWRRPKGDGVAAPRSERPSTKAGRGCGIAAFGIFALFGAGFLIPFAIPAARKLASRSWEPVPATILWSGVGEHSGDDSTTYSVDVLYEYDHGGTRFRANRYQFFGGSSSGETGKREAVARLPPGARVDAWVDPDDPSSAVIERALGPFMWFSLLPLLFVAVGVGGMAFAAGAGGRQRRGAMGELAATPAAGAAASGPAAETAGPITLQPAKSRLGGFFGLLFFTLVWDGIVGVAIWAMLRDGKLGHDGCATAFIGVFAVVGLFLLLALPGKFLALFNPRAELQLSSPPAPGVPVALSWRFHGAAGRVRRLTLMLEGREEATYRRGTDTTTDRRVFARYVLLDSGEPSQIAAGETLLALPADTMHSFEAPRNKIVWSLKLHGDVPRFPDIDDEVTILVHPTAQGIAEGRPR